MKCVTLVSCAALLCVAETAAFAQVRRLPPKRPTGTLPTTPPPPPPALTLLALSHDSIGGGPGPGQPNGKVTLSGAAPTGGLAVILTSDNAAATVPQSVTVPAGATEATFQVTTATVPTPITVRVTARAGSATVTDSLKVLLSVVSVVSAGYVTGSNGTQRLFRVTLSGPAPPGGLTVLARFLQAVTGSCHPAPTFMPALVPAGVTTGDIVLTADKQRLKQYWWEVTYGAQRWPQPQLTIFPANVGPINIPTTITGGTTGFGTVQTVGGSTAPAACAAQFPTWYQHEYTVYFSSSNTAVLQLPSSALISPGQNQLSFAITTSAVTTQQSATITASRRANTGQLVAVKQVTVTVTP